MSSSPLVASAMASIRNRSVVSERDFGVVEVWYCRV
jgi:hypothetical protein